MTFFSYCKQKIPKEVKKKVSNFINSKVVSHQENQHYPSPPKKKKELMDIQSIIHNRNTYKGTNVKKNLKKSYKTILVK